MSRKTRRDVIKGASAMAAMGSLAGCSSSDDGNGGNENSNDGTTTGDGGGQETVTVNYFSATAAEGPDYRSFFEEKSMPNFEDKNPNINVDLQIVSFGDMAQRLNTTVGAGNPPDVAEAGSLGIEFYESGEIIDHTSYIEEAGLLDHWDKWMGDTVSYRGGYWAGGGRSATIPLMGIRPKFFRGFIDNPHEELATWTDFRRALERVQKENSGVNAYEAIGSQGDLEYFWGQARTAYTDGEHPFIDSAPDSPNVKVTSDRTAGMIKNEIDLANTYSSDNASSRTGEEIPGLWMSDRVASAPDGATFPPSLANISKDASFGWPDGDAIPIARPRLDSNYGEEFDIPELAGKSGEHGDHVFGFNPSKSVFNTDVQDQAWTLLNYTNTDPDHVVPISTTISGGEIPAYQPLRDEVESKISSVKLPVEGSELIFQKRMELFNKFGPSGQVYSTGANWDIPQTDAVRFESINATLNKAIAGTISKDNTPSAMAESINQTLNS